MCVCVCTLKVLFFSPECYNYREKTKFTSYIPLLKILRTATSHFQTLFLAGITL